MAVIEQRINGQMGQPAACMIENKEALSMAVQNAGPGTFETRDYGPTWRVDRPVPWASRCAATLLLQQQLEHGSSIHRCCGQLCGQLGLMARKRLKSLGREHIAQYLGMKKSFEINALRMHDRLVTRDMARQPSTGAVVEFPNRSGIGFADD